MSGTVVGIAARARLGDGKLQEGTGPLTPPRTVIVPEHARKVVLMLLAERANGNGDLAFPSIATLAKESGLSERTVRRALASLVADGMITRHRRRRTSSVYDLDLGRLRAAAVLSVVSDE